jgi:hypothetical protein
MSYGESGPWGVWITKDGEGRWYEHHCGGANPYEEDHARALADTLNRAGTIGKCEARPLVWSQSKNGFVAR